MDILTELGVRPPARDRGEATRSEQNDDGSSRPEQDAQRTDGSFEEHMSKAPAEEAPKPSEQAVAATEQPNARAGAGQGDDLAPRAAGSTAAEQGRVAFRHLMTEGQNPAGAAAPDAATGEAGEKSLPDAERFFPKDGDERRHLLTQQKPAEALQRAAVPNGAAPAVSFFQAEAKGDLAAADLVKADMAPLKQAAPAAAQTPQIAAAQQAALSAAPPPVSQIVAAVRADSQGNTVEVRLDPPELGRVRIDFSMETADAVKAVLTAERPETLDHLRRHMNDLMEQLKQAGFDTVDLTFSDQGAADFANENDAAPANALEAQTASAEQKNVVYLSMRSDAQLNLLV